MDNPVFSHVDMDKQTYSNSGLFLSLILWGLFPDFEESSNFWSLYHLMS